MHASRFPPSTEGMRIGEGGGEEEDDGGGAPVDPFTHIYNVAGTMNTAWCVPQGWAFKKCTRIVGWDLWMKV